MTVDERTHALELALVCAIVALLLVGATFHTRPIVGIVLLVYAVGFLWSAFVYAYVAFYAR